MLKIIDTITGETVQTFENVDRAKCIAKTSRLNKGLPAKPFAWKSFQVCVATCEVDRVSYTSGEHNSRAAAIDDLRQQIRAAMLPERLAELTVGGRYFDALEFADFSESVTQR